MEEGPGFYTDEWYRRRSERIFLHEAVAVTSSLCPTDKLTSPSAKSPASRITTVTTTITTNTSSSTKSAWSSAPRNGGAIVLSSPSSSSCARLTTDVLTHTTSDVTSSKSPRQPSHISSSRDVTMTVCLTALNSVCLFQLPRRTLPNFI